MKKPKLLLGVLGFSFLTQLLLAAPAQADWVVGIGNLTGSCVQFDWRGGTATFAGSGAGVFQVDVNNTFDNKIGGGSQADSWSIWVNDQQVVESQVIEQSQVGVTVSGDWVVTVQGIDVGFWAGWYGTQFCNPTFLPDGVAPVEPSVAPEPTYVPAPQPTGDYRLDEGWGAHVVAPAGQMIDTVTAWYGDPNDGSRGADWSQFYTEQLHGLLEADLNSGNYNGDPLPGVYKVLVATVHFVQIPDYVAPVIPPVEVLPTPEPTVSPEPVPAPVVEPSVPVVVSSSEVRPEVPPVQEIVPVTPVEATPSPEPVIVPTPSVEPSTAPVASPEPTPVPDPAPVDVRPSESPVQEVTPAPPVEVIPDSTPSEEPIPAPSESPTEQTTDPTPEETATPTVDVHEPSPSPEPEISVAPTPVPTTQPSVEPIPKVAPSPVQSSEIVEPVRTHANDVKPEPQPVETLTLPDNPSPSEIRAVIEQANTILDSAEPGSPVYEEALNALAEAAQADDPQVPEELANIPGVGVAAVAVMQAFNALGNLGADISPHVRKKMKQVGSAVIVMGIATTSGVSIRRK